MSKIFGGSKSKSGNKAYKQINQAFSPLFGHAQTGASALSGLLSGDASGLNAYKKATGFDDLLSYGLRGVTGSAAANSLLRSGSTQRGLLDYANMLQNQNIGQYTGLASGLGQMGLQAGQLVGQAGQFSKSREDSGDMGKFIGAIMASDRRLKRDIKKVGELENGLNVYSFKYINDTGPFVGVMADEVEKIQPEAIGPEIAGYKTVDYSQLKGLVSHG